MVSNARLCNISVIQVYKQDCAFVSADNYLPKGTMHGCTYAVTSVQFDVQVSYYV